MKSMNNAVVYIDAVACRWNEYSSKFVLQITFKNDFALLFLRVINLYFRIDYLED